MDKNSGWSEQQEQLLVSWAEKASGYTWLHNKSINYYKKRNMGIAVPASIFGYVAGTLTLISNESFDNDTFRGIIGVCGILAGILANLQQIFTFKELSEQHNISSLRFLSFFRDISCELSMHPKYRNNSVDYINIKRLELDKLLEQSPTIPEDIIKEFNNETTEINKMFHKPDITNILQTIEPYIDNRYQERKREVKRVLSKDNIKTMIKHFRAWKNLKSNNININSNIFNNNNNISKKVQVEIANSVKSDNDENNSIISTNSKQSHISKQSHNFFTLQNVKINKKNELEL